MNDESAHFDALYSRVMREVTRERLKAQKLPATPHHARLLGEFIRVQLERQGQTPQDFARALMMKPEVVDHLLRGNIPEWVLSDEALTRMAQVLDCEINHLRIMLKRAVPPAHNEVLVDR